MSGKDGDKQRVVVLGAGIAGLHIAQAIRKRKDVIVTLVAPDDCFTFLPRLTELFSASIPQLKGCLMLKDTWKGELLMDKANLVNPQDKKVVLASGATVSYDILVVAIGSQVNYFNTPGNEYSYPFYNVHDMERLQAHVLGLLEGDEQPGTRTFAVVGGGPTGCEVAYALNTLLKGRKAQGKIIILEAMPKMLGMLEPELAAAVHTTLDATGIEIRLGTKVVNITPLSVDVQSGEGNKESIPCFTTVWAAGSKAQPIAVTGVEKTPRGELPVRPTLQLTTDDSIFCVGDVAASGTPKTAQSAVQQAEATAENIERVLDGKAAKPFVLKEKGTIIALGKDTVGTIFGKLLRGFVPQQVRDKYYVYRMGQYK